MVLTDRQRSDLHAGIHEYLLSQAGEGFRLAAEAMRAADPEACRRNLEKENGSPGNSKGEEHGGAGNGFATPPRKGLGSSSSSSGGGGSSSVPLLEKKWTAVPRLQRRVLELERALSAAQANAPATLHSTHTPVGAAGARGGGPRRLIPRPPATHTLSGHSSVVNSVTLHPLYALAASASDDGSIKLWDVDSGEFLKTLKGHTQPVHCVQFDYGLSNAAGGTETLLVSCSSDMTIKLWTVLAAGADAKCRRTLRGHDHTISHVAFIPSSSSTSTSNMPPSNHVVSASRDHTLKLWEVETGFCIHTYTGGHSDWVRCLAVHRDGNMLASSGKDATIVLWGCDVASSAAASAAAHTTTTSMLTTPSKTNTTTTHTTTVVAHPRKKIGELRGHDHVVESLSFAPHPNPTNTTTTSRAALLSPGAAAATAPPYDTGQLLVSGGRDRSIRVWNVKSMECLLCFEVFENWVRGVVLHGNGRFVVGCGDDRSIRVLDLKSQRCLRTIDNAHGHFVTSMAMHPTLALLVSGGVDQNVKCWPLD